MTKKEALVTLWRLLIELFDDPQKAVRLAQQSGLDPARIDTSGSSADLWWRILVDAHKRGKVQGLVKSAAWEMDEREGELKTAYREYESAQDAGESLDEPGVAAPSGGQSATVHGSGAIAQGPGAVAAGERGVAVGGSVSGSTITTGDNHRIGDTRVDTGGGAYIGGGVRVTGGDFVGRDKITGSVDSSQLTAALAPIMTAVERAAAANKQEAEQQARQLQAELAKGKEAEDEKVASLVEGLVNLVPGAATAVASAFATPILAGLAGPVTKWVLKRLGAGL